MDGPTRNRLQALNRRFYDEHGLDFSRLRTRPWRGWGRLLPSLPDPDDRPLRVLDVGCGNGRFAAFLASARRGPLAYVGVDASLPLLRDARRRLGDATAASPHRRAGARSRVTSRLVCSDFVSADPERALPTGDFHVVALFGVLHHVPGPALRVALLRAAAARCGPGGLLICSLWRLGRDPRSAGKAAASPGAAAIALGAGEHLLPWGGTDGPLRYCHDFDDADEAALRRALSLPVALRFEDDGPSGHSNLYLAWKRESA